MQRSVLAVVHTITAANRLADILTVFDSDRRVQIVYACPGTSAVTNGVAAHLESVGALVMPWDQAISTDFDLAVSVHNSGDLHQISAPLAVLSHGLGYTKYSARSQEPGARSQEPGARSVYGLSREWLTHNGVVTPQAIVLSHEEQHARLAEHVPEALDSAVIAGDPCLDRMLVSEPSRNRFRESLGAAPGARIVLVTSTWGPDSLLARNPNLVAQLLAELPADRYVVAAVLHPNTWFAHGPAQIRLSLADCLRAGLRLVPPAQGWQQAVLAADVVIGDHGAVTAYAASVGRATLLATFPEHEIAPGSAVMELGRTAVRLDPRARFAPQLAAALASTDRFSEVRRLASSMPGRSASILRELFYGLMALPEPDRAAPIPPYEAADLVPERRRVLTWWMASDWCGGRDVSATRWPADVDARPGQPPEPYDRHLVAHHRHPRRDLVSNAAVLLLDDLDEAEAAFAAHPVGSLAVCGTHVLHRDGRAVRINTSEVDESTPIVVASAIHAWLSYGRDWQSLPDEFTVHVGTRSIRAAITHRSGR